MVRSRFLRLLLISILFMSLSPVSFGWAFDLINDEAVKLTDWSYAVGKVNPAQSGNADWKQPDANGFIPDYGSFTTLTYRTKLPDVKCGKCVLYFNTSMRSYEIYVGDQYHKTQNAGTAAVHLPPGKPENLYHFRENVSGEWLLIAVTPAYANERFPSQAIFGEETEVLWHLWDLGKYQILTGFFLIFVGLISLFIRLAMPKDASFLWFSATTFSVGAYYAFDEPLLILLTEQTSWLDVVQKIGLYSIAFAAWMLCASLMKVNRYLNIAVIALSAGVYVYILMAWLLRGIGPHEFEHMHNYIMLATFLMILAQLVLTVWNGDRIGRKIVSIYLISALFGFTEILLNVIDVNNFNFGLIGSIFFVLAQFYVMISRIYQLNLSLTARTEDLSHVNRKLEEAGRIKDQFLANTSHELRTPLHGISGLAEALAEEPVIQKNEKLSHYIRMIISSSRRLTMLINDLLDFSKMKDENIRLDIQPVKPDLVVEQAFLALKPLLGSKPVRWINDMSADTPEIAADLNRFCQIMHNVLSNAVKFTENGWIKVTSGWDVQSVTIQIQDTGIGIDAERLPAIFNGFEQGEDHLNRTYGGIGLGLIMAKRLIELHGGTINAESAAGSGSTFLLKFPRSARTSQTRLLKPDIQSVQPSFKPLPVYYFPDVEPEKDTEKETDTQSESESVSARSDGPANTDEHFPLIWAVDDEPVNLMVISGLLTPHQFEVVTFDSPAGLLDALKSAQPLPAMILSDVMMPGMNGYDLTRTIRKSYSMKQLPVMLITAKSQASDIVTGFQAGANDFLSKPVEKSELLARIHAHLKATQ